MQSLVYIDACMRKESRTRRIAEPIISKHLKDMLLRSLL